MDYFFLERINEKSAIIIIIVTFERGDKHQTPGTCTCEEKGSILTHVSSLCVRHEV